MKKRQIGALIGALGITAAMSGIAQAATKPVRPFASGRPAVSTAVELASLPDRITALGTRRFGSVFGSTETTDGGRHTTVFLTSLSVAAERSLGSLGAPGTVTFALTPHSRAQLLSVHAAVTNRVAALMTSGIRIVSWFPGVNGDGLENIGVLNLDPSKAAVLRRDFGAGNIVLHGVSRRELPVATGNRVDDSSPWNGGDNLTSQGYGCTSAVGIRYNGASYMLTASHCYEPGWTIYNEFAGVSRADNLMGTEASRDVSNGGDDTALLSMPVSNQVWTGIVGQPSSTVASGSATNPDGDTTYNEGAYSGQVPVVVQNNYYGCITLQYDTLSAPRSECNLVEATSRGVANQAGDSGGPVVRYIGGALELTGVTSAGSGPATCQYNTQYSNTCYHTTYYTAMTEILGTEYPGATIG